MMIIIMMIMDHDAQYDDDDDDYNYDYLWFNKTFQRSQRIQVYKDIYSLSSLYLGHWLGKLDVDDDNLRFKGICSFLA